MCVGISCQEDVEDTTQVDLQSQAGVFVITGTICGLGLILAIAQLLMRQSARAYVHDENQEPPASINLTDGEMLHDLVRKVTHLQQGQALISAAMEVRLADATAQVPG